MHIGGATRVAKQAMKDAMSSCAAGKKVATFDTRFASAKGPGAAGKLAEALQEAGAKLMVEPLWFIVTKTEGPLADGEDTKAMAFGQMIAEGL